jgi:hypothetical protein
MCLVVAMEERRTGIIRREIHLRSGVSWNDDNVFIQSRERHSIQACDFESMAMQMKGVIIRAVIDHPQAISLALPQDNRVRMRKGLSVDRPGIERALPVKL